eukprot:1160764-Pelagomonas_calceolata.AAC.3
MGVVQRDMLFGDLEWAFSEGRALWGPGMGVVQRGMLFGDLEWASFRGACWDCGVVLFGELKGSTKQ